MINPFYPNAPFLYSLTTSENQTKGFLTFSGGEEMKQSHHQLQDALDVGLATQVADDGFVKEMSLIIELIILIEFILDSILVFIKRI